ncbi:MAG TPA: flagellar basal body rod protein FlgB, partial [Firmicutes bacterium]|nr:flagellar basal body rod protein FlgB [Bacillota bacterium]
SLRGHLIAHNIANADTPNYKAKRLRFEEFLARELGADVPGSTLPLARTNSLHLPGTHGFGTSGKLVPPIGIIYTQDQTTFRLDGNNVDIDHEMAEQAKNALQYSAMTDLVSRRLSSLRTAISEGRR